MCLFLQNRIIRFILTKWYVNSVNKSKQEFKSNGFILTKWYVNNDNR